MSAVTTMTVPPHGNPGTPERAAWNAVRKARLQVRLRESGLPLIECVECGRVFRSLIKHVMTQHSMTIRDYRIKHAIKLGFRCVAPDLIEIYRGHANDPARLAKFKTYISSVEHLGHLAKTNADPKVGKRISEIMQACLTEEQREVFRTRVTDPNVAANAHSQRIVSDIKNGRRVVRTCLQCGNEYPTKSSAKLKYCSDKCYFANLRKGQL